MKRTNQLAAAGLAVGFALALTGRSTAATPVYDNLTLDATPSVNLYDAYYFYSGYTYVNSVLQTTWTLTSLGNLTGGVDNTINFSALRPAGDPSTFVYGLFGVYDVGNQLVTVGVNSAEAASLIASPASFFSVFTGPYTESQVATAAIDGDTATMDRFFLSIPNYNAITSPLGTSGEFFNFSTSSPGGFFTVSASPEPGTLCLLGMGALGLAGYARRRAA